MKDSLDAPDVEVPDAPRLVVTELPLRVSLSEALPSAPTAVVPVAPTAPVEPVLSLENGEPCIGFTREFVAALTALVAPRPAFPTLFDALARLVADTAPRMPAAIAENGRIERIPTNSIIGDNKAIIHRHSVNSA